MVIEVDLHDQIQNSSLVGSGSDLSKLAMNKDPLASKKRLQPGARPSLNIPIRSHEKVSIPRSTRNSRTPLQDLSNFKALSSFSREFENDGSKISRYEASRSISVSNEAIRSTQCLSDSQNSVHCSSTQEIQSATVNNETSSQRNTVDLTSISNKEICVPDPLDAERSNKCNTSPHMY